MRTNSILVLVLATLGACDDLAKKAAGGDTKAGATTAAKSDPDDPDAQLRAKLNGYVACENGVAASALSARDRYFSWFDAKLTKPSTYRGWEVVDIYEIRGGEECLKFLAGAAATAPKLDKLDPAGAKFADALRKLLPQAKAAHEYFEQKNWKDDKAEGAKKMHGPLVAAFDDMSSAHRTMVAELDAVNDALQERNLAQLEKQGRNLPFLRANLMIRAKKLLEAGVPDGAKLDALTPAYDAFEKAETEIIEYVAKNKASVERVPRWSMFESAAKELQKASKDRLRRVRDNKPYTADERQRLGTSTGSWVEGGPDKMIQAYNSLVDNSNYMQL